MSPFRAIRPGLVLGVASIVLFSAPAVAEPGPVAAVPVQPVPAADPPTAAATRQQSEPATEADTAGTSVRPPAEYLWVLRTSLVTTKDIDRMLERARAIGVRGLLVQVVGRGDAWYESSLLPRAEALPRPAAGEKAFDPLGYLLPRAHAAGLEVHAWMNACLVWSARSGPRDPEHVIRRHPEWVARLHDGRSMTQLSARQRRRLNLEGVYLSPAHPGVRTWIAKMAQEIATHYSVDGIHLDYIRLPAVEVGYDPTTRARFALETGVDRARMGSVPLERRAAVDSAWGAFQGAQVTAIVREVRDSLQTARAGLTLSAAVVADTGTAEKLRGQPWRSWLRAGLLDMAFVMSYAPEVQTVLDQLLVFADDPGVRGRVVPGIAVFNSPASSAAAKIKGARALGYATLALYSYDSLYDRKDYWPALQAYLETPSPDSRP